MDGRFTFVPGEVVEVDALRKLVHTFVVPNLPDALRTEVVETELAKRPPRVS